LKRSERPKSSRSTTTRRFKKYTGFKKVMKNNEVLLEVNKNEFEVKQAKNENKRKNFEAKRRRSLELRRKRAEEKSQEIQRILATNDLLEQAKLDVWTI
jgi:hypothetical protein